jgi:hypothetical protein
MLISDINNHPCEALMEEKIIFKPRPSIGWLSLALLAGVVIAIGVSAVTGSGTRLVLGVFFIVLGLYFVVLTLWWPTMRYELDREAVTLLYGRAIKYRIPLDSIRSIKRVDLGLALWSSLRMPGVALFNVPDSDVGQVRMCSTSALNGILLIETEKGLYGVTPEEEGHFASAVQARIRR